MINLRKIDENNFIDIIHMKRPTDEKFVASNAYSLAQAWLYKDNNDVFPYAIYNDDTIVGFVMLDEDLDDRCLLIWRIMFPEENTNKGYGTETIKLILKNAKESGKYDYVQLDYVINNERAKHVYEKLGFVPTGEMDENEVILRYNLKEIEDKPLNSREYMKLDIEDIYLVLQMEKDFRPNFINENNARIFLSNPKNWIYACVENKKIIGFAYGYELNRLNQEGNMLYIHEVGILDDYQHQGIGTELMERLKRICKEMGMCRIFLLAVKNNINACKLYEKVGMKSVHDDDIVFYLSLK